MVASSCWQCVDGGKIRPCEAWLTLLEPLRTSIVGTKKRPFVFISDNAGSAFLLNHAQ